MDIVLDSLDFRIKNKWMELFCCWLMIFSTSYKLSLAGAEEFEVKCKVGDHLRILRLRRPDGTYKYGWSSHEKYKVIHEIKRIIK